MSERRVSDERVLVEGPHGKERCWSAETILPEGHRPALRRHANNPVVPWSCSPEGGGAEGPNGASPNLCWSVQFLGQSACQTEVHRPVDRERVHLRGVKKVKPAQCMCDWGARVQGR